MNWYLMAIKNYATFSGRSRRKEYWCFFLFNIVIGLLLSFVDRSMGSFNVHTGSGLLGGIYTLAVFLPGIAVAVRRLHDTNRSGWWLLIFLIPIIGVLVLAIFMLLEGDANINSYGDNPKAGGNG
ncbi:DUF805 domain-containing protein [Psychromonas sp. RZ22]|uniref:DUF805 domain-containing protein n=1 Tax=Psychromonas algarum TaxID=2555643 RepID=UPI00106786D0|nr:DUF805 domain-containing protein [Psychromonas sp. RZ22]TEW55668.1 DUF805 domain-containing protein [Psychromonas sp. RZ22]